MRLPRRVRLLDYVVTVRQVSRRDYNDRFDGEGDDGHFQREDWTIYLVRSLPAKRKRWIFLHEVQHALVDIIHHEKDHRQ